MNDAVDAVAARLGNTPAVLRRSYLHPAVIEAFHRGGVPDPSDEPTGDGLTPDELALLELLSRPA